MKADYRFLRRSGWDRQAARELIAIKWQRCEFDSVFNHIGARA